MNYFELVSVIIPTYNRSCLLLDALQSVRWQTYRPIEIIVVDDGSTDDTQEVVKQFSKNYCSENFQILYFFQENKGPSAARNVGLKAASGKYIQFLDSDDLVHPNKIEIQVGLLNIYSEIHCVFSERFDFRSISDWDTINYTPLNFLILRGHDLYCSFKALTNSGIYKKEICFLAGLWNEEMHLCEDLEFNLRVLNLCEDVLYVKSNLAGYRKHDGHQLTTSISNNKARYAYLAGLKSLQESAHVKVKKSNSKLFESISILYNRLAIDFMLYGDRPGALKTIDSCMQMPLSEQRLKRLTILRLLTWVPSSWFRLMWKVGEYYRAVKSSTSII